MDAAAIDKEFEQLQAEFQDVAKTVATLAAKMQAAEKAGSTDATAWLADLKQIAQDVDDEQAQVKALLLALHDFVGGVAQQASAAPAAAEKPPLFAPGQEPDWQSQGGPGSQHHGLGGMLGGMVGGGMMGGGMFGGYYGGGFGRAMEMGMAMNLGANLIGSIFR